MAISSDSGGGFRRRHDRYRLVELSCSTVLVPTGSTLGVRSTATICVNGYGVDDLGELGDRHRLVVLMLLLSVIPLRFEHRNDLQGCVLLAHRDR